MKPKNPNYQERILNLFKQAPFITQLGIWVEGAGPGWCKTGLAVSTAHCQQDGFVHAGVQATLADHSAGAAAATLVEADELVLTVEFKINLLRPALGEKLTCKAMALKPGRTLSIVESEVYAHKENTVKLVSKAMVTIAIVKQP